MEIKIMYNRYGEPVVYDTRLVAYKYTEDKIQYFYAPGRGTKTGRTFRLVFTLAPGQKRKALKKIERTLAETLAEDGGETL